jgi:hypothetical protein
MSFAKKKKKKKEYICKAAKHGDERSMSQIYLHKE